MVRSQMAGVKEKEDDSVSFEIHDKEICPTQRSQKPPIRKRGKARSCRLIRCLGNHIKVGPVCWIRSLLELLQEDYHVPLVDLHPHRHPVPGCLRRPRGDLAGDGNPLPDRDRPDADSHRDPDHDTHPAADSDPLVGGN